MKQKKYKINADKILFTQLGDEAVIYEIESNKYFSLNDTYCSILLGIQENLNVGEIQDKLMDEYNVSEADCKMQLEKVIEDMVEKGYLIPG